MHGNTFRFWVLTAAASLVAAGGPAAGAESPWQVEVRFGESRVDARFGTRHVKQIDDQDVAGSIELGYSLNRHLAVQLGYHDLGSHGGFGAPCPEEVDACIERLATLGLCAEGRECLEVLVPIDAELDGWSLALVPRWPLGERLALRGRLGVMAWDGDLSGGFGFGFVERFSGEELLTGVGVEYRWPRGLGLTADYERFDLDAGAARLGVSWRF